MCLKEYKEKVNLLDNILFCWFQMVNSSCTYSSTQAYVKTGDTNYTDFLLYQ